MGDNLKNEDKNNNYIIAEINIEENNINKDIRIINTFEESKRINEWEDEDDDFEFENEKEIKENCIIKINNKVIPFNYFYKFKEKGKCIIEYSFKKNIKSLGYIFSGCNSFINIDLSHFNTENINDMNSMFEECNSLTYIDLSNLNTKNVTNMGCMFNGCRSLLSINLSNFNTQNVTNMNGMFSACTL